MSQLTIMGDDGNPILYASMNSDGRLFLEFEYFACDENEGDYEFNHTVGQEEFTNIAQRFGLDPATPVLDNIMHISASGRGKEFQDLLTKKEIPNEFWSWLS